jgi:hypothetical protein
MANTINHSELLKATKKAVNSFMFNPTSAKQKVVLEALASLTEMVSAVQPKAAEPKAKPKKRKASSKKTKAVRKPRRTSAAGLELAQAKTATANKVGKAVKTKVVHAITEGDAQPFEPRKEVVVAEPKARKKAKMKLTLLPGESPEEAMARFRSAQLEAARLEAEALIADTAPTSDDLPF